MARVRRLDIVALLLSLSTVLTAQSGSIQYVYDELGRLVGVVDQNGNAAVYRYDAVGNLLSIARTTAGQVSIIDFAPNSGPTGTAVTIYGTSFSPTPSQNTVQFNGATAAITEASATRLVVSLPSGATTGPITVTAPAGTATSSDAFLVTADNGLPSISGFTPAIGAAGATVTIAGTNFDVTPAKDDVRFHLMRSAVPSSATTTSLTVTVPPSTTSGRIRLTTPLGVAVSASDFFVPPSPYGAADVVYTGRIAPTATFSVPVLQANKVGLIAFDGVVNQRISVDVTSASMASYYIVYRPDGTQLFSAYCNVLCFVDTKTLLQNGTYLLLVDPNGTSTGSATLTMYNVPPDFLGTITPGGSSATVTTTVPGQDGRLTFPGTAGQRISVQVSNSTVASYYEMYKPDGSLLTSAYFGGASLFFDQMTLATTGTYIFKVNGAGSDTGSATVTVYDIPPDFTGSITPGGAAVTVTTTVPGQNGQLTFPGSAGQRISVQVSNSTLGAYYKIYKPDGTLLSNTYNRGSVYIDAQTLPTSGTYRFVVDGDGNGTGSTTILIYDVPPDFTGSITPGGAAVTVTTTVPGQNGQLTFPGSAGQRISVQVSNSTIGAYYKIYKPDGTLLSNTYNSGSIFIDTQTLPTSGTYTFLVDGAGNDTGSTTILIYDVPPDFSGPITADGQPVTVTMTAPGQNGALTFAGSASQKVSFRVANSTVNSYYQLYKPDGTQLSSNYVGGCCGFVDVKTLPTSGTYTLKVDPLGSGTGSTTVYLYTVVDVTGSITVGGASQNVTLGTPGQNATYSMDGTAGQSVTVRIAGNTMGFVTVKLIKPDGTTLTSSGSSAASFNLATQTLPVTGTYTILIDPYDVNTGALSLSVTTP